MIPYPDRCPICGKPRPTKANLKLLRNFIIGGTVVGGVAGVAMLPLLGFGLGGIAAGSVAASWQSTIGAVSAGSIFATLQSLGATGIGMLVFGPAGVGIGILTTFASVLGFCEGHDSSSSPKDKSKRSGHSTTDPTSGLATSSHR